VEEFGASVVDGGESERGVVGRRNGVGEESRLGALRLVARRNWCPRQRWDKIGRIEVSNVKSVVMEGLDRV
jgi:hypothetical protein